MAKKETKQADNPFEGFNLLSNTGFHNDPDKSTIVNQDDEDDVEDVDKTVVTDDKDDDEINPEKKAQVEALFKKQEEERKSKEKADSKSSNKTVTAKSKSKTEDVDSKGEDDENLDEDSNENLSDNESLEENKGEESDEFSFKPLVEYLSEKQILDYSEEDFEDNEEGLEKVIDKTVKSKIDSWKNSYPEDVKKLLEYVEEGGDPKRFLDIYYNEVSWKDFNIDSENNQKIVIKESLKLAGWTDEEIQDELELYEDSGKLEAKAQSHLPKLQKYEDYQKEQLTIAQKEFAKKQEDDLKNYWEDLKSNFEKKEDLNGFKLTPKIKSEVWDHMSRVADKKSGKTQLQINNEKNKDAQFLYAYLDYLNWDINKLVKQAKTEVTSNLRQKLSKFTDSKEKINSGRVVRTEGESDPFKAFKTLI